jgi:hypothetical protein
MNKKTLIGPLVGILVAIIIAVAVVIPVTISMIGYNASGASGTFIFGFNSSNTSYSWISTAGTVAQLFPLLVAVLVLVGIAGYMTLTG